MEYSFGVGSYALNPGELFKVDVSSGGVNYAQLQKDVDDEVNRQGVEVVLSRDEYQLNELFQFQTLVNQLSNST